MAKTPDAPLADSETARLVGTWELVTMSWTYPDGRRIEPWGNPVGRISYDGGGNVVALLMHEHRNQAGGNVGHPDTVASYSAYFGTYRVDPSEGVIRHQVLGSLNAENASGELQRSYAFEDDMLILGFTAMREGVPVRRRLVWKRLSGPTLSQ